ncbi:MAG TPA: ADOP family duplicated permease [Bryobacteraceae bacterium]|nr:ADOP family duplicated permease [Bryobacteraceae bacterium]
MSFLTDFRIAFRSLLRTKGLAATVVLTLALGIGANAAIFALVRGVLLRPLVNRDENRLVYIRQSAPGLGIEDTTFSVPEIRDLQASVKSISEFGDFSTIGFTMVGLGEPREIRAGVVGGTYFDVMGLRPVLGRLLGPNDDGPKAAGAVVLTHRFWTTSLKADPSVLGKVIRLGDRPATIVGVLEPCVPYPAETELIANIVTSPHHLSATMVTGRVHRMTELFGRLAPGADLPKVRAELDSVYMRMVKAHPEAYSKKAASRIGAVLLRDQITAKAKTVLLVLMAASALVFLIACSNVANLILARTVRREGELGVRAALGASPFILRRMLLTESVLLCGTGAILGLLSAGPMVSILARYAARYSVRALDLTVDWSIVWIGAGLAIVAAILLAFVPRLPSAGTSQGNGLASGSLRITAGSGRKQKIFAVTQIAASFVLLTGAVMLLKTLLALQSTQMPFDMQHVVAINVPVMTYGRTPNQVIDFYKEAVRRIKDLPGVTAVAVGTAVPWRDANFGFGLEFSTDSHRGGRSDDDPRARYRVVSSGFFAALGVRLLEGRDFDDRDRATSEPVVIVSKTLAERMFPHEDALNHYIVWTDPVTKFVNISQQPRRIIGVAADVDDENVVPAPMVTIYHTFAQQELWGGRMFVHTQMDPRPLIPRVTGIVRGLSVDQPIEHAATLEDIRADVLTPDRLNTLVFGVFAAVALAIAVVGVASVLAFSVSARTREFGIRMAIGSDPQQLVHGVLNEGAVLAGVGVFLGAVGGLALFGAARGLLPEVRTPGVLPIAASAVVLLAAAVTASLLPALRAAQVNVVEALRSE